MKALFVFISLSLITNITLANCDVALLPIGGELLIEKKKEEIVLAFEKRGYNASVVSGIERAKDYSLTADASLDCLPTYLGNMGKTTIRLIDTKSQKILERASSDYSLDIISNKCKIDLVKAIENLSVCK